ncbi:MAG TPA: hypothetical protein VJT72_24295 [Pseudonocardiaceae bacterium]|nr:hypothetical protein [Pseudonocardiaceae bacterium]
MTTEKNDTTDPHVGAPRRVRVKGMQGIDATVVVTVVRDTVWMSISPPLTWEAIMEPGKVDDVISALELARDQAKKAAASSGQVASGRAEDQTRSTLAT